MVAFRFFWDMMGEQTELIRRVVEVLERRRVRFALIGGHAVSYHWRQRATVDVDFLVAVKSLDGLAEDLRAAGFVAEQRGEILRAWPAGADPKTDEPVVDLVPSHYNRAEEEAVRTAIPVQYLGIRLKVVSRPALVALKFLSALSEHRAPIDKQQDAVDLARVIQQSWSPELTAEARRLVELSHPGLGRDFEHTVDDVLAGRPVTI